MTIEILDWIMYAILSLILWYIIIPKDWKEELGVLMGWTIMIFFTIAYAIIFYFLSWQDDIFPIFLNFNQMVNKILICIKSDNVCHRGGDEIKPGEKYHIDNIIDDYVSVNNRIYRINQGANLIGFFHEEDLNKYFQPIEDYRNNIIDKILN